MQELLKIMTCGSVDDGKSTLIGHLMYNAKVLLLDQTQTLRQESNKLYGEEIDYSLLVLFNGEAQLHHCRYAGS